MNTLLMVLFFLGFNSHDVQVAHFKIKQEDHNLVIDFTFEYDDILSTQKNLNNHLSDENLQDYINSNFTIAINKKPHDIAFENKQIKNKHIYVEGRTSVTAETINTIEITNTCLLNIGGHSNIIEVSLHDKQRDFLMNRNRTYILISY